MAPPSAHGAGEHLLGDFEKSIRGLASPRERLVAAAELHHAFGFDPISDCEQWLDYEPRCSASCAICRKIWIGSKAGEVLCLRLASAPLHKEKTRLDRGIRALVHAHELGQLIAGTDGGHLVILGDELGADLASRPHIHLQDWFKQPGKLLCPHVPGHKIDDTARDDRFNHGITAMVELPRDRRDPAPSFVDIVVATRFPMMFVVRLHRDAVEIRGHHVLSGWTRNLTTLVGADGEEILVCATRGGELLEWNCRELSERPDTPPRRTPTSLLPTAIGKRSRSAGTSQAAERAGSDELRTDDCSALLVGSTDGLHIRRPGAAKPVHVAATSSSVLSIATVTVPSHREGVGAPIAYAVLGLEDGRLRVIERRALFGLLDGEDVLQAHDLSIDLGAGVAGAPRATADGSVHSESSVLVLEILGAAEPRLTLRGGDPDPSATTPASFVLAALRDHRLRLFRVRHHEALREDLGELWRHEMETGAISAAQLGQLLEAEERLRGEVGRRSDNALRYLLVDEVLPRWTRELGSSDERIVDRACQIASDADEKVLYRLSAAMGDLTRTNFDAGAESPSQHDPGALIQISMACLAALPQRDPRRWRAYVSHHLKQFHACANTVENRDDISRLQHWGRFVRKYLLLGETFADKRYRLAGLMERNRETRKFLAALIYAAQLERQRYDLKWSTVCRDRNGEVQEIARVDLIDDVAIVVTMRAEIMFYRTDRGNADILPLRLVEDSEPLDQLSPRRGGNALASIHIRRAARVIRRPDHRVRIALTWESDRDPAPDELRVTIFDVHLAGGHVEVEGVYDATTRGYPRNARGALDVEVHGLVALEDADAVLVGLDSSESPLALLKPPEHGNRATWILSPLAMFRADAFPAARSTPVPSVAALKLDQRDPGDPLTTQYLAAAGASDGALRFVVFDLRGNVTAVDSEPTLVVYPIHDIALRPRSDYPGCSHVCYAGTETGVSFCWLINIEGGEAPRKIVAQQLWRDLYEAPVLAVRPWEPTAARSPYDDPVVFIATQDGRVAIYRAKRGAAEAPTLSTEAMNYRFEGMRFDRIVLPGGLVSWAIQRGRSEFLAASSRGRLEFGEFHHPRGSVGRADWLQSIDRLYEHVMSAPQFFGAKADEPRRREICAMISIRGGALRSYILRKQFEQADLTEARLDALLAEQFDNVSSDLVEVQDRIKVAIKMVRTRVLDRDPDTILEDCRLDRSDDTAEVSRVRWACRRLSRYLVEDSAQARPGAVRVRRVIMYALFRLNVLRHAARDEEIQSALVEALTACLRDEDRIVRVEALRAVAVGLRNVSLLFPRADNESHREALRSRFFPPPRGARSSASGGLETIQWLVDAVLRNFARYRRHGEPVLLSTAWSYTTVLVSVIRLFPGSTLALCEQISRWGLGDHLQIVHDRLRGDRIESVRWRIRELCIVPSVRPPAQPRTFIEMFNECDVSDVTTELALAPGDGDRVRASELLQIYSRVALLWNVDVEADLMRIPLNCRQRGALPEMTGNLAGVKRILEVFVEIADGPPDQRRARLAALNNEIANEPRDRDGTPEAVRLALEHVVQRWQAVLSPKIPTTHDPVATYTLDGRRVDVVLDDWLMERGSGQFYAIKDDAGHVIKILRGPLNKGGLEEFHRNARLSREMAERYPEWFVGVHALNPTFGYAVMETFQTATEYFAGVAPGDRPGRARTAAVQLVRALRYLHVEHLAHRDLRAKNILVSMSGGEPIFRFGDLHVRGDDPKSRAELEIPVFLRNTPSSAIESEWIDLLSLTLFLYWALTGKTLPTDATERSVAEISATLRERADEDIVARVVSVMLSRHPHVTAQSLEWAITFRPPRFEPRPLGARPLAPFDVFISYKGQDSSVARALHTQLTAHGFLPYLDQREVYSERIANEISVGIGCSRAFAILVGDEYRDDRFQAMEVRAALDHSGRERLPVIVLQLGEHLPDELEEARGTGAIRVIRARRDDVAAMAREVVAATRTGWEV